MRGTRCSQRGNRSLMAIHRRGELYSWAFTVVSVTLACIGVITHFIEPGHPLHLFVWGFILGAAFWWTGIVKRPDIFCCKFDSHKWNYELAMSGSRLKTGYRWCVRCPKRQVGKSCTDRRAVREVGCPKGPRCGCLEWKDASIPKVQKRKL